MRRHHQDQDKQEKSRGIFSLSLWERAGVRALATTTTNFALSPFRGDSSAGHRLDRETRIFGNARFVFKLAGALTKHLIHGYSFHTLESFGDANLFCRQLKQARKALNCGRRRPSPQPSPKGRGREKRSNFSESQWDSVLQPRVGGFPANTG